MSIGDSIGQIAGAAKMRVEENLALYRAHLKAENGAAFDPQWIYNLLNAVAELPPRDHFTIDVVLDGNGHSISANDDNSLAALEDYLDINDRYDDVELTLAIRKGESAGRRSVYSLPLFAEWIEGRPLSSVISAIGPDLDSGPVVFDVLSDCAPSASTGSIAFQCASDGLPEMRNWGERRQVLQRVREECHVSGLSVSVLPSDFRFPASVVGGGMEGVLRLFAKLDAVLCALFLANVSVLHDDDRLDLTVKGYKAVVHEGVPPEYLVGMRPSLLSLFDFAFGRGQVAEKLGVVRNVISLHCPTPEEFAVDDRCVAAVKANYNILLTENVEKYLALRGSIVDVAVGTVAKSNDILGGFVESFRKNTVALLAFLVSIVLVNGIKERWPAELITPDSLVVLLAIAVISLVWCLIAAHSVHSRRERLVELTEQSLVDLYGDILPAEEIKSHIKPQLDASSEYVEAELRKYEILWLLVVCMVAVLFTWGRVFLMVGAG